jgi:2-haloalkanoic acid dehalogenase type II
MRLTDFAALTFDCYGTLIDWERGMLEKLRPWAAAQKLALSDDELLEAFGALESEWEAAHPQMLYPALLAGVHKALAERLGVPPDEGAARAFGASVGDWPAFADSPAALGYLAQHYKLVILSNVDEASIARSLQKLGARFDLVVTAEQVGSYKPDRRNFERLIAAMAELGVPKGKFLHVAQSLYHDHVPATALGLPSCWIDRRGAKGGGATKQPATMPPLAFTFPSMAALAEAHKTELAR